MSDQPSRSDLPPARPRRGESVDVAVLRSLMLLTAGLPAEFSEHELPAENVQAWIGQASLRQMHGLLISALRRWHRLRRQGGEGGAAKASR